MALRFLFNDAGIAADSIEVSPGTTATGFATTSIMTGARSTGWRSNPSTANGIGMAYDEAVPITHVVVARADKLLTRAGQEVFVRQRTSGGSWSPVSGTDHNPLTASDLVGSTGQDLVLACSPADLYGVGLYCVPAAGASEASEISKLHAGSAFSFIDADPSLQVVTQTMPPGSYQSPMRGTLPYEVEARFSLRFEGVYQSEIVALLGRKNLLYWPLFLWDEDQAIWEWQLEHVLVAGFNAVPLTEGRYLLELSFFRLRHYDS